MQVNFSVVPEFYRLFYLASVLQSNDIDDELANISVGLLAMLSHCLTPQEHVPILLDTLKEVSECPFWSARAVIPEFLQIFVFHNMSTVISNKDWIAQIQKLVLTLLEDVQLEVRLKAQHVLSDFLHCQFIPNPMEVMVRKNKIRKMLLKLCLWLISI